MCVQEQLGDGQRGGGEVKIQHLLPLCSGKQILSDDPQGCFEKVFPSSSLSTVLWQILSVAMGHTLGHTPALALLAVSLGESLAVSGPQYPHL